MTSIEADNILNKKEESWDVLARRNLLEEVNILKKCQETSQIADFTIAEFEEKAVETYKKSLDLIPSERMHLIYLDFLLERIKLNSKYLNEDRFQRLNEHFQLHQAKFGLSIDLSLEWIDYLIRFNHLNQAINLIEENLRTHKTNANLWKSYLRIRIDQTNESNQEELVDLFNKAINLVKQKEQLDLWTLMVNWCLLNNYSKLEEILVEGSKLMCRDIASFVRTKYLNWSLQSAGLDKTRKVYEK